MKVGIVTTLIDAENVIKSFVNYHLKTGFDRIYLFFDNPNDPTKSLVEGNRKVSVIPCNVQLKEQWKHTNAYKNYGHLNSFIQVEPMARQILNMDVACKLAQDDGIEWLLHIDIDELFYSPHEGVHEHFEHLASEGVFFKRYLNFEAIPEKESIQDYFKEVTLFKKNPEVYSFDERINHQHHVTTNFFTHYQHGKMAAQASRIYVSGIHEFVFDKAQLGKPLNIPVGSPTDPTILHYPCCGFQFFWDKFMTLGNFNENIFGRELYGIYKSAKEVIKLNDRAEALKFYQQTIMWSAEEISRLLQLNLIGRIDHPSKILGS
jgi:hypothetical protein